MPASLLPDALGASGASDSRPGGVLIPLDPYTEFRWLDDLRRLLRDLRDHHRHSLDQFRHEPTGGFLHFTGGPPRMSRASTSVAVMSLSIRGEWKAEPRKTSAIVHQLLNDPENHGRWFREGLGNGNVFTVGFALEAADELLRYLSPSSQRRGWAARFAEAEQILKRHVARGWAQIPNYPPSAYMTQLAVRVLLRRGKLRPDRATISVQGIRERAWAEVASQLALALSRSKLADVFELGYAILICVALSDIDAMEPERSLLLKAGLDYFFAAQMDDGTWPRGRPRFPDLKVGGSGFSYDYELLVQLLQAPTLQPYLFHYLHYFDRAARALVRSRLPLSKGGWGWTSGNYLRRSAPESWTTASAYHFAHALDRLLAIRMRQVVFDYLGAPQPDCAPKQLPSTFANGFLDCPLNVKGKPSSLRDSIDLYFAQPLRKADEQLLRGIPIPEGTPMSAIFFGPPGTSKTKLAKLLADFLGWPLLELDPSHLFRHGGDMMQAEADRVFSMLAAIERVVVLLDEFDEMGRDRQISLEMTSRLLTTVMLPKFTNINESRRIVFIVATNYIDSFDLAIRRPGRFDLILQVLPPLAEAKIDSEFVERKNIKTRLEAVIADRRYRLMLEELTFYEFKSFVSDLPRRVSRSGLRQALEEAHKNCTMATAYERKTATSSDETWQSISEKQEDRVRLRPLV